MFWRLKEAPPPAVSGPWPQVCFMHIGKTAGSSLFEALLRIFQPSQVYQPDPDTFDRADPSEIAPFDLVAGHHSYNHTRKFRANRTMFTFVREPVDRVVSSYYFIRSWSGLIHDGNRIMVESARNNDLLGFLRDDRTQVRSVYDNQQTYTFATDWRAERRKPNDEEILALALDHLRDFELVGLTDRIDDGLKLLTHSLHWAPFPTLDRSNRTQSRPKVAELTAEERDAIESLNRLDSVLYREAKRLFDRRWAEHVSRDQFGLAAA